MVPQSATVFAQVVEYPYARDMSLFRPITVREGTETINFPERMKIFSQKSNADYDVDLSQLRPGKDFQKLSNALEVFK